MDIRTLSRGIGAFCLVVGSVGVAVPVTVTEKELDGAGQLSSAAAHLGVTHLGNVLLLAQIMMVPAMVYAARLARHRAPKLAFFGGGLSALAWLSGLIAFGGVSVVAYWGAQMPDNAAVATVLDKAGSDPVLGILTLVFVFGHLVGMVLLGAALWKSRAVPVWAAISMILFAVIHNGAHAAGSVLVDDLAAGFLLVASVTCAVTILRTPNDAWDLPTRAAAAEPRLSAETVRVA
jgi:hypothetical protein